eukprot:1246968-Rhodomonas_salina.1
MGARSLSMEPGQGASACVCTVASIPRSQQKLLTGRSDPRPTATAAARFALTHSVTSSGTQRPTCGETSPSIRSKKATRSGPRRQQWGSYKPGALADR